MQTESSLSEKKGENQTRPARLFGFTARDFVRGLLFVLPILAGIAFEGGRIHRTLAAIEADVGDQDKALGREVVNRRAMINEKIRAVKQTASARYAPLVVRMINLEETARQLPVLGARLDGLAEQLGRIDKNVDRVRTYLIEKQGGRSDRFRPPKKNSARLR